MNPEYDYLFKHVVRARDDAMRCVRDVNAFRFGLDHASGTCVCRCDLVLGMREWNACVCIARELGRGVKDERDGCVRTKRASVCVCRGSSGGEREERFSRVGLERGENGRRASERFARSLE